MSKRSSGWNSADTQVRLQQSARAEAVVINALERQLALDDILGLDSEKNDLPRERVSPSSLDEVETLADGLRERWDLGNDPVRSMTGLLEDKGIKVIAVDISKKLSGLTGDVQRPGGKADVPIIVVSNQFTIERRRFTLAHELGHRIIAETKGDLKLEKAVNRFAGAFLIPKKHLQNEVAGARDGLPPYNEIVRLKHFYGVAAAVILMRLKDIRVLSESSVSYAFQTFARRWRTSEPEPLDPKGPYGRIERPTRFERSVYWALTDRLISLPRAAELLQQSVSQIELAVKGPTP